MSAFQLFSFSARPTSVLRPPSSAPELGIYACILAVLGAWMFDLHFHWDSLPDYQFGWIVAFLALYLAWERWPLRPKSDRPASNFVGIILAGLGTVLVLLGRLYEIGIARTLAASFLFSFGCLSFISAIFLQGLGRRTYLHFIFPLLFLFVAVPVPKILWDPIVLGLQRIIAGIDTELLKIMGIPAVQQGTTIRLSRCIVGIDEACSGVRSLQSSIMAGLFVGDLVLRRRSLRVVLVACGIGLALAGNLVRSMTLSLAAERGGPAALERIHDSAGWTILAVTAGGVAICAWLLARAEAEDGGRKTACRAVAGPSQRRLEDGGRRAAACRTTGTEGTTGTLVSSPSSPSSSSSPADRQPSTAYGPSRYFAPAAHLALFAFALIVAWAWFHVGVQPPPARVRAFSLKTTVPGYTFVAEAVPTEAVKILGTTNLVNGRFRGSSDEVFAFLARWGRESSDMTAVQHTPDICWVGAGWKPVKLGQPESTQIAIGGQKVSFECRAFVAPDGRSRQLALWCTLLGGGVLEEGNRWASEEIPHSRVWGRADVSSRRMAVSRLFKVVRARIPGSREKQFFRLSSTILGADWETSLRVLESFVYRAARFE